MLRPGLVWLKETCSACFVHLAVCKCTGEVKIAPIMNNKSTFIHHPTLFQICTETVLTVYIICRWRECPISVLSITVRTEWELELLSYLTLTWASSHQEQECEWQLGIVEGTAHIRTRSTNLLVRGLNKVLEHFKLTLKKKKDTAYKSGFSTFLKKLECLVSLHQQWPKGIYFFELAPSPNILQFPHSQG